MMAHLTYSILPNEKAETEAMSTSLNGNNRHCIVNYASQPVPIKAAPNPQFSGLVNWGLFRNWQNT